jgi:cob(I)alamin adenosyltransferase
MSDDTRNEKHQERMRRKKAVVDQRIAEASTRRGVLLVNTGIGKVKSSTAFDVVARALGNGLKVAVIQFVKNRSNTGEETFFRRCADVRWHVMGDGFT